MAMRMAMELLICMKCDVCRQLMIEPRLTDERIEAAVKGAAPYGVCPCCGQKPDNHRDRNYRARARRWLRRRNER